MKIVLGITGASGSIYARRLAERLLADPRTEALAVVTTENGLQVTAHETGAEWLEHPGIIRFDNRDFYTPIASGSASWDAMVVIPCSMGMAARIAHGISDDLLSRAADVMLKERRQLIVCPRETPLSLIHLRNLTSLAESGAVVLPAAPSFYTRPDSINQLVDTVVNRILAHLDYRVPTGWQEEAER